MLNPNTTYRKTDAGVSEVQSRALGLRAELRRLLILIDGTANVGRLANFVRGAEIDFLIAELETQGLITTAAAGPGGTPAASPVATSTPLTTPTGMANANPPTGTGAGASALDNGLEPTAAQMLAVRRAAIRTLHDLLGPSADGLAVKIERCKDAQDMRVTITEIRQILDRQMGASTGQRFLDAVRGAAEGTR